MAESVIEVRCVACDKDFSGMALYDEHMQQVHGITDSVGEEMLEREDYMQSIKATLSSEQTLPLTNGAQQQGECEGQVYQENGENEMENPLVQLPNVKQEPMDTGYYGQIIPSQMYSASELLGSVTAETIGKQEEDGSFLPYPVTLTKSCPIPVSLLRTDTGKDAWQSLQDTGVLPAPEELEHAVAQSSLIEVRCKTCGEGFMYADDLETHNITCKVKGKKNSASTNLKKSDAKQTPKAELKSANKKSKANPGSSKKQKENKGVVFEEVEEDRQNEKLFNCDQCDKTYKSSSGLRRHSMIHAEEMRKAEEIEKKLNTPKTRCTLNSRRSLDIKQESLDDIKQEIKEEKEEEKAVKDPKTKTKTNKRKTLPLKILYNQPRKRSRRKGIPFKVEKSRRHRCRICGVNCGSYHLVLKHENQQHDKGGFQCRFCTKSFNYPGVLRTHERVHTGEKPYKCVDCARAFADCSAFRRHKKIHEKEKIKAAHDYYRDGIAKGLDFRDPEVLSAADEKSAELGRMVRLIASGAQFEELKYYCNICHEGVNNKYDYVKHMEKHTGERPYKCLICNKGFLTKSHLRGHEFIHTGETPYACSFCGKKFNARNSMRRHEALHSGAKICKCKSCDESFNTTYQLRKHIDLIHNGVRPYQCTLCPKGFLVRSHLTDHERTHTNERPFVCQYCNKNFSASNSLKRHEKIHTNDRPHKCTECDKAFIVAGDLRKHMRTHSDERPFVCDIPGCSKTYKFVSDLRVHKERHNNPNFEKDGSFPCSKCDLVFHEVTERQAHVKMAHPRKRVNKPVCCQYCGKEFNSGSYLKIHERTHTGESFQCEYCGKAYIDQRLLKFHIRTHTGEKPYSCEYCGKTTATLGEMKIHTRVHTGETPYKCQFCEKSFRDGSTRKVHEKRHTGDKKHKCTICDKAFVTAYSLRTHLKVHLKDNDNGRAKEGETKIVIHFPKRKKKKGHTDNASGSESDVSDIVVYADDEDVMAPPKDQDDDDDENDEEEGDMEEIYDSDLDHLHSDEDDDTEVAPVSSTVIAPTMATIVAPDFDEENKHKNGGKKSRTKKSRRKSQDKQVAKIKSVASQDRGENGHKTANKVVDLKTGKDISTRLTETVVCNSNTANAHLPDANVCTVSKLPHSQMDHYTTSVAESISIQSKNSVMDTIVTDSYNCRNHNFQTSSSNVDDVKRRKLESRFAQGVDGGESSVISSKIPSESSHSNAQSPHQLVRPDLLNTGPETSYNSHLNLMSQIRPDLNQAYSSQSRPDIGQDMRHDHLKLGQGMSTHRRSELGQVSEPGQVKPDQLMSPDRQIQSPPSSNFPNWHQTIPTPSNFPVYGSQHHQAMMRAIHEQSYNNTPDIKPEVNMFGASPLNLASQSPYFRRDIGASPYPYNLGLHLNSESNKSSHAPVYSSYLPGSGNPYEVRNSDRDEGTSQQQQQNSDYSSSVLGFSALQ